MGTLLEHHPNMRVRGVHGPGEDSRGFEMLQRNSRGQGSFGGLEGCLHGGSPHEVARNFASVNGGRVWTIPGRKRQVEHAEELLEGFHIGRKGKVEDGLNTGGERRKSCGCDSIT